MKLALESLPLHTDLNIAIEVAMLEQLGGNLKLKQARLQCVQVFNKQDLNLPLHITLGYLFTSPKYLGRDEIANFNEAVAHLFRKTCSADDQNEKANCFFVCVNETVYFIQGFLGRRGNRKIEEQL